MAKVAVTGTLLFTGMFVMGAIGAVAGESGAAGSVTGGSFPAGANLGLNAAERKQAARALTVADKLKAKPPAVLAMVVSALGESHFNAIPNNEGSGYCGVFQAHPKNIACSDTEAQARAFLKGGKGFQQGGAIFLTTHNPSMSPGEVATRVEASGKPPQFYDVWRGQAEKIIAAWRSGGTVGQIPFGDADAAAVLANSRIHLTPGQRADVASGGLDARLLSSLNWLGSRHDIQICALRRDHKPGTNHEMGRAADVCAVDMFICRGGTSDPCADAVRELADVRGPNRSTELIYCWDPDPADPNMFAKSDHCDHFHLGWDGRMR